jgi:hypothetical protein
MQTSPEARIHEVNGRVDITTAMYNALDYVS